MFTGIKPLVLIHPFIISSFFFLSNFQTLTFFVTLFSGIVRSRKFKVGTHVDNRSMYCAYLNPAARFTPFFIFLSNFKTLKFFVTFQRNCEAYKAETWYTLRKWVVVLFIPESDCWCIFVYFFIFLSNFQTLKFFVTLFSETVRPTKLKLGTHVDNGLMYCVYWNRDAGAYLSFQFFLSLQILIIKNFVALFSGTMRPRKLKLGIHLDSGLMYCVYQNKAAGAYSSIYYTLGI